MSSAVSSVWPTALWALACLLLAESKILSVRNVAVAEYEATDGSLKTIARASQRGVGHAERNLGRALNEMGIDPSKVRRIYSELQPCNMPGGYCDSFIQREYSQSKVTWTFEYGDTPQSRTNGVSALKASTDE